MLHDTNTSLSRHTASRFGPGALATAGHTDTDRLAGFARTVLVVEDEVPIRLFLAELLRDSGYVVLEAGDVAQAKRLLMLVAVDAVFSDVNMPGTETGFDLEKWVRVHYPHVKIALTSGYPQCPNDTAGLQQPLIMKPYSCAAVLACLQRLCPAPRQ